MRRLPEAAVVLLAAAAIGAVAAVAHRRQRAAELSPYPGVENPGPRGLAALHAWLVETGRAPLVLASPDDRPPPGATLVLAAPRGEIEAADAEALLGQAAGVANSVPRRPRPVAVAEHSRVGLAFTWCQVPIVYRLRGAVRPTLTITRQDGSVQALPQLSLPAHVSSELFRRSGHVSQITLDFPGEALLGT